MINRFRNNFGCRSRNSTLSQQLDHVIQTNAQLQAESRQLSEKLEQTLQTHQIALEKLESLEEIQTQLNRLVLHDFIVINNSRF